jgi:osmotically-inducible protein OsmY
MLAIWLAVTGCKMSDQDVKEAAGNAAVKAKHAAQFTQEQIRNGYNSALEQGRKLAKELGEKADDALIRTKILAGFKLISGLDASNVTVEVKNKVVTLEGTVPTLLDQMKVEGIAYGVTGDAKRVRSLIRVVPK